MATELISKSWRLVCAEKRLMLIPLGGGIIALIIGGFATFALGVDNLVTISEYEYIGFGQVEDYNRLGDVLTDDQSPQWIVYLVQGLVAFFFQFVTLSAVFRALANKPYAVGAAISETWSRIGRVVLFTLLIALLTTVNAAITAILASISPPPSRPSSTSTLCRRSTVMMTWRIHSK